MIRLSARVVALVALAAALTFAPRSAAAQSRDSLVNGAIIGAAAGAGLGIAFTHAVRDSELTAGQYARGAIIFGAIGAGAGLGVDALFHRAAPRPGAPPRRLLIVPSARDVAFIWRWGGSRGVTVRGGPA